MRPRLLSASILSLLLLTGCLAGDFDPPTDPAARDTAIDAMDAEVLLRAEYGTRTGNHFVVFSGAGAPKGFNDTVSSLGGSVVIDWARIGAALIGDLEPGAAASLEGVSGVRHVFPEHAVAGGLPPSDADIIAAESGPEAEPGSGHDPTGATFFRHQWHLQVIQMPETWETGRFGSADVTVAILDTGLDYLHPDLAGRVDLSRSASFVASDDALVEAIFPDREPITDLHWHGTHVGATVASNAVAAAGVTRDVTLLGAKVCSVQGSCPESSIFSGLLHALDQGADVANMSLGGAFLKRSDPGFVAVVNRLTNELARGGMLVVVAAGNNASDLDRNLWWIPAFGEPDAELVHLPTLFATFCDATSVACVSATGPTAVTATDEAGRPIAWEDPDAPAAYTNFGRSAIDVAAPGGSADLVWGACSTTSLVVPVCQSGVFVVRAAGTSMAAPHASGVAALLVEQLGRRPARLRTALRNTADGNGSDPYLGRGRINAFQATTLGGR